MTNFFQYLIYKSLKKLRLIGTKNSTVHKTAKIESGSLFVGSSMDKYSFCGYDCEIINCEIGAFCSIANNVKIGGGHHPIDWVSTSPVFYKGRDSVTKKFSEFEREEHKKTIIGNDVWIGSNCLIKQGVIIGTGSVIGMGSVITKNVAPYSVVVGVPGKTIAYRFEPEIINDLLKSEWWNFDDAKLIEAAKYFKKPIQFLKFIKDEN